MQITVIKNIRILKNKESLITFEIQPNSTENRLVLNAIVNWRNSDDLLNFAIDGHGYGNTDSLCGIMYENDIENNDNIIIPNGFIQAYSEHHDLKETCISEIEYLTILKAYFTADRKLQNAERISKKITELNVIYKNNDVK